MPSLSSTAVAGVTLLVAVGVRLIGVGDRGAVVRGAGAVGVARLAVDEVVQHDGVVAAPVDRAGGDEALVAGGDPDARDRGVRVERRAEEGQPPEIAVAGTSRSSSRLPAASNHWIFDEAGAVGVGEDRAEALDAHAVGRPGDDEVGVGDRQADRRE